MKIDEFIKNYRKNGDLPIINLDGDYLISKDELKDLMQVWVKEQLLLHNVVKPFYCYENLANGKEKCSNECIDCVGIKPVQ